MVLLASAGSSYPLASELTPNAKTITRTIIEFSNNVSFFISPSNENIIWLFEAQLNVQASVTRFVAANDMPIKCTVIQSTVIAL